MITNVSPKKRLHHNWVGSQRTLPSDQGSADAGGIGLHRTENEEGSPDELEEGRDRSKEPVIGSTTYKNILKTDKRETNECIVQRAGLPSDVVGSKEAKEAALA